MRGSRTMVVTGRDLGVDNRLVKPPVVSALLARAEAVASLLPIPKVFSRMGPKREASQSRGHV